MPELPIPIDPQSFVGVAAAALASGLALCALRPGWIVGRPRSVLGLLALGTLLSAAALLRVDPLELRLRIDPSTEPLVPRGDPAQAVYRDAVRDFGDDQVFLVAMESDDVFDVRHLTALRRIGDRISRLDGVRSVRSLVNVGSFRYLASEDWIEIRPLVEAIPTEAAQLASLRERALASPLYRDTLVSADGRGAAIHVRFRAMTDGELIASNLDTAIREILEPEAREGRSFYVSGRPHIKSRMYHAMARDLAVLIPVALCVVALALSLLAGTGRAVVLPLVTVATAVTWTFAALAALDRALNVLTVLLAPTLVAVGSVYGVHVVGRYEEEVRGGGDARAIARRTLDAMIAPVLLSGSTTAIGFGALMLSDVPAVFEVGAFSVLGVSSVTLLSLSGIPAVLALLPVRRRGEARTAPGAAHSTTPPGAARALVPDARLERALLALAGFAQRRSGAVILGWGAVALLAASLVPRVEVDTDYLSFFDERSPVRVHFERIDALLAGVVPLYLVLEGDEPGGLRDPETLRGVERIQRSVERVPEVRHALSFLDTLKPLHRAIARGDPAEERIPDTRSAVAELLFMIPKDDLERFATVDQSSANLVLRTGAVGSASLRRLAEGVGAALAETGVPEGFRAHLTGNALLLNRAADGVARGQPRALAVAAVAIFALLALALRSPGLGLVAMVPNTIPVLLFFGMLGAGLAPLSLPTSLIGSVALGIAIDATAHYLVRYREERRAGRSLEDALRCCNLRVGRPIAIGTLVLCLGFASVATSELATIREFGLLTAAVMAVCCLTDLLLLPAILWRVGLSGPPGAAGRTRSGTGPGSGSAPRRAVRSGTRSGDCAS